MNVYQGTNTEPLYIKAGSFSFTVDISFVGSGISPITTTFSGVSNGSRYLVLPLSNSIHRFVISNSNLIAASYRLMMEEETGTVSQPVGRLLVDETPMGYFSNNEPVLYWIHIPANLRTEVQFSGVLSGNHCGVGSRVEDFGQIASNPVLLYALIVSTNSADRYHIIRIANDNSSYDYRGCQLRFRFQ